jgi:hypothetical protein
MANSTARQPNKLLDDAHRKWVEKMSAILGVHTSGAAQAGGGAAASAGTEDDAKAARDAEAAARKRAQSLDRLKVELELLRGSFSF